jgi:hypothetical protein
MELPFFISLGLNILQAVLLFFKSTINEIVKEWWVHRLNAKREHHDRLIELRSDLYKLRKSWPLILTMLAIAKLHLGHPSHQTYITEATNIGKEIGPILQGIKKNEVHFSVDIRTSLSKLPDDFGIIVTDLLAKEHPNKTDILDMEKTIDARIDDVITLIDRQLLK